MCECIFFHFGRTERANRNIQIILLKVFSGVSALVAGCPVNTANYWNEPVDIYIVYYRSFRFVSHDAAAAITIIRLIDAMIRLKCKWLWGRLGVEIETRIYEYTTRVFQKVVDFYRLSTHQIDENFVRSIFSFSPFPHKIQKEKRVKKDSIAMCCNKHGNINEDKPAEWKHHNKFNEWRKAVKVDVSFAMWFSEKR